MIWCKMGIQSGITDQQQSRLLAQAVSHRCGARSVNRETRKALGKSSPTTLVEPHAATRRQSRNSTQSIGLKSGMNHMCLPFGRMFDGSLFLCCQRTSDPISKVSTFARVQFLGVTWLSHSGLCDVPLPTQPLCGLTQLGAQVGKNAATDVLQLDPFEVVPGALIRVQIGRATPQALPMNSFLRSGQ